MHCLPVVAVCRPDTVQLSGSTTLKATKATCNWIVTGFDMCPKNTRSIRSPIFSHGNSSKWCVELEKKDGNPIICFRLVGSSDFQPVCATLTATVLDREGYEQYVYPAEFCRLEINQTSSLVCLLDNIDPKDLSETWDLEFEVCTMEVVTADTSNAAEEEGQSTVDKDMQRLLDSKQLTDITLNARGVRLEAHKAILCARSPVFRAMLSHDTKEAREGLVEILDIEPEVVLEMLRYMYTDRVQLPSIMTKQLLVAFDKYGLQDAKLQCEYELAKQLTVDSAADTAACAVVHSCSFLQKVCTVFIKQHLLQVVGSRGWANMIDKSPKTVKRISELVTGESESCSSPDMCGSQSEDITDEESMSSVESVSEDSRPTTYSTSWDPSHTQCGKKNVVYAWTITGLRNWPQNIDCITSPRFYHPESIQWEVRLYRCGTEDYVRIKMLENKAGESVVVDLSVSVIPPIGEKCKIQTLSDCTFKKGSMSDKFKFGYLDHVVVKLVCEISMVCVIQRCLGAIKPLLLSDLREDLNSLLESGNFADFKLCAGTINMEAHRAILAARSPVFARMLQPGSEVLKKGLLEVSDVNPGILTEVLHYMYCGRVKDMGQSVGELLVAAHRFELCDLKNMCITYLSKQLTVGNAISTAIYAMDNHCDTLLNLSVGFIRSHFQQVMGTAKWFEAIDTHPTTLKRILQLLAETGK